MRPHRAQLDIEIGAIAQIEPDQGIARTADAVGDLAQPLAEQFGKGTTGPGFQPPVDPLACNRVRTHDHAIGGDRDEPLLQAADVLRTLVEGNQDLVGELGLEQAPFDQLHRQTHQPERVALVCPLVARDIEHARQGTARIENGRSRARQEGVVIEEVLATEHDRGRTGSNGGTDRIGATRGLAPACPGLQRDATGLIHELGIAQAMHDRSARIGQDHQATRGADLFEYMLHNAAGVFYQAGAAVARLCEPQPVRMVPRLTGRTIETQITTTHPGIHDLLRDTVLGQNPLFKELAARPLQAILARHRLRQRMLCCHHVSSGPPCRNNRQAAIFSSASVRNVAFDSLRNKSTAPFARM
ncbi:hypothetical protein TMEC54S_03774 [Thauera mechernichensis]